MPRSTRRFCTLSASGTATNASCIESTCPHSRAARQSFSTRCPRGGGGARACERLSATAYASRGTSASSGCTRSHRSHSSPWPAATLSKITGMQPPSTACFHRAPHLRAATLRRLSGGRAARGRARAGGRAPAVHPGRREAELGAAHLVRVPLVQLPEEAVPRLPSPALHHAAPELRDAALPLGAPALPPDRAREEKERLRWECMGADLSRGRRSARPGGAAGAPLSAHARRAARPPPKRSAHRYRGAAAPAPPRRAPAAPRPACGSGARPTLAPSASPDECEGLAGARGGRCGGARLAHGARFARRRRADSQPCHAVETSIRRGGLTSLLGR